MDHCILLLNTIISPFDLDLTTKDNKIPNSDFVKIQKCLWYVCPKEQAIGRKKLSIL